MSDDVIKLENAKSELTEFRLPASRHAMRDLPQAQNIERSIELIELIPASNSELVFDLCRSLIETVCKTILNDLNEPLPPSPNAENMVPKVLARFQVFLDPEAVEAEARRAVGDTVHGINKFVNGIGEYRRRFGSASHGRDGYIDGIDISHAKLTVGVTDALISFLIAVHRRLHGQEEWFRASYGEHEDFNQFLDDEHDPSPINVFGDEFRPSELLYSMNRSGYIKRLNDWRKMQELGEIVSED